MTIKQRPPTHTILSSFVQNLETKIDGTFCDSIRIDLQAGETVAIVGPNGVGKSALVDEICRNLRNNSEIEMFSGHRQIHFQSDDVDQVGLSLNNFAVQLNAPQVNRVRNPWGEQHLRSVVRRLINRQHQDNDDMISVIRSGISIQEAEATQAIVLDELNGIFEAGRLAVRIVLDEGTLKATKGSGIYGLDRMSDGERAALLVVGAILVRPTNGRIAIDEPEKHLNPAISGPLISAAINARPDLGYLFATHDLNLLDWMLPNQVIHVSSSDVILAEPEIRRYKLERIGNTNLPSESLKKAVFGSRKALLLVEGTENSSDEALFGLIYKDRNVTGRGGSDSVISDVKSLNRNSDLHWLSTSGIIDGDGREEYEINALKADGIFCLPCPTIENLFFDKTTIFEIMKLQHDLSGGARPEVRLESYEQTARQTADSAKEDMIDRRTMWRANRDLAARKISVKAVREGQAQIKEVEIQPIRDYVQAKVEEALSQSDIHKALMKLPIKNTAIPAHLSSEIGFVSFIKYKQAVLHQVQTKSSAGIAIINALAAILPELSPV